MELPWAYKDEQFDYIHWRSLDGSTGNWQRLYAQAMENLNPGAYLEVHEHDLCVYSDDGGNLDRAP
jgi:hypothetical protein